MRPVIWMHACDYDRSADHGAQWQELELIFGRLLIHGNMRKRKERVVHVSLRPAETFMLACRRPTEAACFPTVSVKTKFSWHCPFNPEGSVLYWMLVVVRCVGSSAWCMGRWEGGRMFWSCCCTSSFTWNMLYTLQYRTITVNKKILSPITKKNAD